MTSNNRKKLIILIIILSCLLVVSYGVTYAKYASNSVWNYYLESKGFYFTSKSLENRNIKNDWDGSRVYFDVRNSLNSYVATEYDINYEVTCNIKGEVDGYCRVNGSQDEVYKGTLSSYEGCVNLKDETDVSSYNKETCNEKGYSYRIKESVADNYFEVFSNDGNELNNITVEVIVKSTSPYTRTLKNEFILSRSLDETGSLNLIYNEYDQYSRVVISNTYSEDKCVKLSFDSSKIRIDNDTSVLSYGTDENGYINSATLKINVKSTTDYLFYRVDNNVEYLETDFELVETECQDG